MIMKFTTDSMKDSLHNLANDIYANCATKPTFHLQQLLYELADAYRIERYGYKSVLVLPQDLKGTYAYITAVIIYDEKDNMLECIKLIGG